MGKGKGTQQDLFTANLVIGCALISKHYICSALVSGVYFTFLILFAGSRISTFTQADLASRSIQYVHTSEEEKHSDDFTFVVSDGANEVQTSVRFPNLKFLI